MIQELFGGSDVGLITGERVPKLSTINGVLDSSASASPSPSPSLSPSSSTATTTAAAAATATTTSSTTENLRCPRCDSSNTKFCYYNNYNLTQPRHFCKTCRRYWTKGGALRNVPIGGGCRKNKNITITTSIGKSNTAGKFKTVSSEKTNFFSGFENHVDHLSWSSPQNSHLLSLLRINQIPNPNPNLNPTTVKVLKDEGAIYGFDHPINQMGSSTGLPGPFWSNNQQQQIQANSGIILGEVQNNGLQEIYQRLRSSSSSSPNFCYPDQHAPVILGNLSSATSMASSTILDSAPVAAGGELGFWSTSLSGQISDLATTNGAYP